MESNLEVETIAISTYRATDMRIRPRDYSVDGWKNMSVYERGYALIRRFVSEPFELEEVLPIMSSIEDWEKEQSYLEQPIRRCYRVWDDNLYILEIKYPHYGVFEVAEYKAELPETNTESRFYI